MKTATHTAYVKANLRLEELLKVVSNDTPKAKRFGCTIKYKCLKN